VQGPKKGYPKILFQKDSAKRLLKKVTQKESAKIVYKRLYKKRV